MPEFILTEAGSNADEPPIILNEPPEDPFATSTTSVRDSEKRYLEDLQTELDEYFAAIRKFQSMDISEILLSISAFSARAAEIRSHLMRSESRRLNAFRTREIDPFLQACEFQFRIHSRLQAIRELEFKLSGGAP
jgi:hypothetical protein